MVILQQQMKVRIKKEINTCEKTWEEEKNGYEYKKDCVSLHPPWFLFKKYYTRIYHYVSGIIFNFLFKHYDMIR